MRVAPWLFLTFLALYTLTSGGHFYASDDVQKLAVLDAIFQQGHFAIADGWVHADDGRRYAWFTLGASLVMLPGWLGGQVAAWAVPQVPAAYAVRFAVALENAAISAVLVTLTYAFARATGARVRGAAFAALALGLGTLVWPYSKTAWSEPAATLALYAGLYALYQARAKPEARARRVLVAGVLLASCAAVRQELVIAWAGAVAWWLFSCRNEPRRLTLELACLCAPVVLVQAGNLAYDAIRYGTAFGFPNYRLPQKNVIMEEGRFGWSLRNLYQYTLSPNQGLPWYSPAVLLAVPGLLPFWRTSNQACRLLLFALLPLLAFYVVGWGMSSWAWGLRYSYVFLPALLLPAAWALGEVQAGKFKRLGLWLIFTLALGVQLLAIVPNPLELYEREIAHTPGLTIQRLMLAPAHAPLWLALKDDGRLVENGRKALIGKPTGQGSLRARRAGLPDVWWILILLEPVPRSLVYALTALLLFVALFALGRLWLAVQPGGTRSLP